jgi:dCTP deaminase
MTFWSGEKLRHWGDRIFVPYSADQIDRNAYVLRMGDRYYRTADEEQTGRAQVRTILSANEAFQIPPGQFAFLLCKETIKVPNTAMAFISMRTPLKFRGLINVSGFHVDPGYNGQLVYAVFNAGPSAVQLKENDLAFKIWFCDLDKESSPPYIADPNEGLRDISNEMVHGMSREILSLQNMAKKLQDQERDVERRFAEQKPVIDNLTFIWRAIMIGVIGAVIFALITFTLPLLWTIGSAVGDQVHRYLVP